MDFFDGRNNLQRQRGSIIVPVLMVLALISIVGLTAANTTTTELQIVRNKVIYKQNLYLTEAAVIETAKRLDLDDNLTNIADVKAGMFHGVYYISDDFDEAIDFMRDPANWDSAHSVTAFDQNGDGITEHPLILGRRENNTLRTSVVYVGVVRGTSLSIAKKESMMHLFAVYGRYDSPDHGQVMVEMRYKRSM